MLTEKQQKILDIIRDYINKEKMSPTIREIGIVAGLRSSATVHSHIETLEEKGYIYRLENCPRSIRVKE